MSPPPNSGAAPRFYGQHLPEMTGAIGGALSSGARARQRFSRRLSGGQRGTATRPGAPILGPRCPTSVAGLEAPWPRHQVHVPGQGTAVAF